MHMLLAAVAAGNAAYCAFSLSGLQLGVFVAITLTTLLWYRGLRRLFPGPIAASQFALLRYPALVYLVAAPAPAGPEPPLVLALVLVYLCFSVFELLHDARLLAARGSAALLALAMLLMLGVSGLMGVALRDRGESGLPVQGAMTALGAAVFLFLFWRRHRRRAPGGWDYLVFVIGAAWVLNFSLAGREFALPALGVRLASSEEQQHGPGRRAHEAAADLPAGLVPLAAAHLHLDPGRPRRPLARLDAQDGALRQLRVKRQA
jgi:hypothetical protein